MDGRTDGQAQTNMPPQLLRNSTEHSGRKNKKKKKRRRERKMDLQVANPTEYNERQKKERDTIEETVRQY